MCLILQLPQGRSVCCDLSLKGPKHAQQRTTPQDRGVLLVSREEGQDPQSYYLAVTNDTCDTLHTEADRPQVRRKKKLVLVITLWNWNQKNSMPSRDDIRSLSTEQRWIPPSTVRRDALTPESRNDLIFRKVRGILNKLTPEKFAKLSNDLLNVELNSHVILKGVIFLVRVI